MQDPQSVFDRMNGRLSSARDLNSGATRQPVGELNEFLRRFLHYKGEAEWVSILLDGTGKFSSDVALFSVRNGQLELRGGRGSAPSGDLVIPVQDASAFESVLASSDVVVTLRTVREVSAALSGEAKAERAYLFPILNGTRVAAILFAAESEDADMRGVELVCGMASLVLQRQANAATALQIAPSSAATVSFSPKSERKLPPFADLSDKERSVHLRARRMARLKVAEMQLAHPEAARAGREQNDVYLFLKNEIDAARESYQAQFGEHRRMVDYLHLELVHALADGDEEKLGEEYPSQLD